MTRATNCAKTMDVLKFVSVATTVIPDTTMKMGIAYFHPDESSYTIMNELMKCLSLESDFKKVTLDMIAPHFYIDSVYENSSKLWMAVIVASFFVTLCFGCVLEYVIRKRAMGNLKIAQKTQEKEQFNSKYLILVLI